MLVTILNNSSRQKVANDVLFEQITADIAACYTCARANTQRALNKHILDMLVLGGRGFERTPFSRELCLPVKFPEIVPEIPG